MDKFKPQMTFDEMARAFSEDNPWLKPNNTNVGLFAKRHIPDDMSKSNK